MTVVSDVTIQRLRTAGSNSKPEFHPHRPYSSNSEAVVRSGDRIELRDLTVTDCRNACLLTVYHGRKVAIARNEVSNAAWDGITLNCAGPTRVTDNLIHDNTAAGVTVEHLHGGEITGNRIERKGSHGV